MTLEEKIKHAGDEVARLQVQLAAACADRDNARDAVATARAEAAEERQRFRQVIRLPIICHGEISRYITVNINELGSQNATLAGF